MTKRIAVPHFATESEEADWWYANRHEHDLVMAEAMEAGSTMTLQQVLDRHGIEGPSTAVRVDPQDLARARAQAAKRGLQYEDYIRQLLHQALLTNDAA